MRSPELQFLKHDFPVAKWCSPAVTAKASSWLGAHLGAQHLPRDFQVAFFRRPLARMLSGYLDGYHDFPGFHGSRDDLVRPCTQSLRQMSVPCIDYGNESGPSFGEYAAGVKGMMTRMLSTPGLTWLHHTTPAMWHDWRDGGRRPESDLPPGFAPLPPVNTSLTALRRMRFVGITERWATSICLWHLQFPAFGGRCLPAELRNVRDDGSRRPNCATPAPSARRKPSQAQCEQARESVRRVGRMPPAERDEEYRDEEDEQVYAEALRLFDERVAHYGASRQRCREMGCVSDTQL